jgi:uncharacterized membrane protein
VREPEEIPAAYRETFVRGVSALLPVVLTIAALAFCWNMVDSTAGGAARALLSWALGRPVPQWAGTIAAIPALALLCVVVGGTVGGATLGLAEEAVLRVPFAGGVYSAAREVVVRLAAPRRVTDRLARGVVAAPFGRGGAYAVGLLVGTRLATVPKSGAAPAFPVFVSHVPTTVTGFLILSREETIIPLEGWKVEDFARFYTSGGLARPATPADPAPDAPRPPRG